MGTRYHRARSEAHGPERAKYGCAPLHFRPKYEAPPAILTLLRNLWAVKPKLRRHQIKFVWSLLQRAQVGPLTDRQIDAAAAIGQALEIGFDDPRLDVPVVTKGAPSPQPWGPLPLRPPGR